MCTWNNLCVRFEWTRRGRCYPVWTLKFLKASSLPKASLHLTSSSTTTECVERALFSHFFRPVSLILIFSPTKNTEMPCSQLYWLLFSCGFYGCDGWNWCCCVLSIVGSVVAVATALLYNIFIVLLKTFFFPVKNVMQNINHEFPNSSGRCVHVRQRLTTSFYTSINTQ